MHRWFVTGTDTGVGKTFVSVALARAATARGHRVFAFKPIETGVTGRLGEDQQALVDASGGWPCGPLAGVYQFALPAAPSVAAAREGKSVDLHLVETCIDDGAKQADVTIVEGAGGWRVPIDDKHDMAELARRTKGQVIVAARGGLGTINHSLLTLEAIERDGFTVAALVLSVRPDDERWLVESNLVELRRCWKGLVLEVSQIDQVFSRST